MVSEAPSTGDGSTPSSPLHNYEFSETDLAFLSLMSKKELIEAVKKYWSMLHAERQMVNALQNKLSSAEREPKTSALMDALRVWCERGSTSKREDDLWEAARDYFGIEDGCR